MPSQPFRGDPLPYAALLEAVGEAMITAGVENETLVGPAVSGFDMGFIEVVLVLGFCSTARTRAGDTAARRQSASDNKRLDRAAYLRGAAWE